MRGTREVVLVDAAGREMGLAPLADAHRGTGQLHRAFTAVLFDASGRVVLARRAASKPLWPGWWDATVASHPRQGESVVEAGRRRLREELGVDTELLDVGTFRYFAPFGDAGSERESCAALFGWLAEGESPNPHPEEISEVKHVELGEFTEGLAPGICPWAWLAFEMALESREGRLGVLADHRSALADRLRDAEFDRL